MQMSPLNGRRSTSEDHLFPEIHFWSSSRRHQSAETVPRSPCHQPKAADVAAFLAAERGRSRDLTPNSRDIMIPVTYMIRLPG